MSAETCHCGHAERSHLDAGCMASDVSDADTLCRCSAFDAAPCACGPSHDCRATGCDDECEACNA